MRISASGSVSVAVMAGEGNFSFDKRYYFDPDYRWQQRVYKQITNLCAGAGRSPWNNICSICYSVGIFLLNYFF